MERQIKFRFWDKKNKSMSSNYNIYDLAYEGFPGPFVDENGDDNNDYEVDVMQFTGLLDKNGKEIYEGDILKCKYMNGYDSFGYDEVIVEYRNGGFFPFTSQKATQFRVVNVYVEFEILGNIYENKNLIK
ncbi:MAG TPA: YopX family protein [Bacilli bacterium]|nr:YopX family protein [Bacilli bacterium]